MSDTPNIVVFTCDQLRAHEVGCYGNTTIRTPNIDAFAAGGVRFEHAVSNYPLCVPARSALMSGQYPRRCTDLFMRGTDSVVLRSGPSPGRDWFPDPTGPQILQEHGYETALIGTWHVHHDHPLNLGYERALRPFDPFGLRGPATYQEGRDEKFAVDGYLPDFELEHLRRFLEARDRRRPFFLNMNTLPPHMPIGRADVPPAFHDLYAPDDVPLRDNVWVNGELVHDEFWFKTYTIADYFFRCVARGEPERPADVLPDGFDLRDLTALYYEAATYADSIVGRAMSILDDARALDESIVVLTCDHGDNLGSHGRFNKEQVFEESIRIPMAIRAPGVSPAVDTTSIAQLVDVVPTVFGLAELPVPEHVHGRDLTRAVRGEGPVEGADASFVETINGTYGGDEFLHGKQPFHRGFRSEIAIRTSRYLVGMRLTDDHREIADETYCAYDLEADPFQLANVAGDPGAEHWQRPLRARLTAWHEATPHLG